MDKDSFLKILRIKICTMLKRSAIMCFVMRKPESTEASKEDNWTSNLSVYFTDGSSISWTYIGDDTGIKAWKRFYKWWFSRLDSECYLFRYNNGETMIRRSLIKSFVLKHNGT